MNHGELLELAAVVAAHGPALVRVDRPLPPEALKQYWSASKCRQDRWARALKQFSTAAEPSPTTDCDAHSASPRAPRWQADARSVVQEILASEVLTRAWTALLIAHDRRRQTADAEPIARSIYVGQLEARHRALAMLVQGEIVSSQDAVDLNRVRRQAERWNDMLIGQLLLSEEVAEFAFDAGLAREFADDFRGQPAWQEGGLAWSLFTASLRAGWREWSPTVVFNGDLNAQIGAAILGCFGLEVFDCLGLPKSLWAARLLQTADDARAMIDNLFAAERAPSAGKGSVLSAVE